MKNKTWIIIAVVFVAIMILALMLYPKLSDNYYTDEEPNKGSSENIIQAEDFTVYDSEMNEVKLSDYFGKPIIINFWASWCGPCKSELPAFNYLYEEHKDEVVFLMINLTDGQRDTESSVKQFVYDNGYSFPVYYDIDYDASGTYGVSSIPQTVFINADGSVYDTRVGALSEDALENYIEQMIGEDD